MNRRNLSWHAAVLCLAVSGIVPLHAGDAGALELRWRPDHSAVEVRGLPDRVIQAIHGAQWPPEKWAELLSVRIVPLSKTQGGMPSMLGGYAVEGKTLVFTPRFPWQSGQSYHASFQPGGLPLELVADLPPVTADFTVPMPDATPSTVVSQIYPAVDIVPENLLKFYLHFSAPMSGGQIYQHIHLKNEAGNDIELPFLEINEELWDRSMTRLTLFIDPGRIKREVKPLEDVGPALEAGKRFTLVIDAAWPDALGRPMKSAAIKSFSVGPPDRQSPDPAQWTLRVPRAGTLEPLSLTFTEPMDSALALRHLTVIDATSHPLEGQPGLALDGRHWTFLPSAPWPSSALTIIIDPMFEDLAGNTPQRAFEVDVSNNPAAPAGQSSSKSTRLPFTPVK